MHATVNYASESESLRAQLAKSRQTEAAVDKRVAELLQRSAAVPRQLGLALSRLSARQALVESDAKQLGSSLALTSVLAENVSGKVRELDVAKGRVVECLQRVEDLMDLRLCTVGVRDALDSEDFEQAAGHIHRFLALDSAVFRMGDSWPTGTSESGGQSLKQSYEVLRQAEQELRTIVERKFDEAVTADDVASIERFFKIFPLLNQHELGLRKFCDHLRKQMAPLADKSLQGGGDAAEPGRAAVFYADALTILLEGVARIVEVHQPLVETFYGPEHMLTLVQLLQVECDVQVCRVIDAFVGARDLERKLRLVESFARSSKRAAVAAADKLDALQLDALLSELALIHTRAELYLRFVRRRVGADLHAMPDERPSKAHKLHDLGQLLANCRLSRRMQELIGQYVALEQYYMGESVKKAMAMDARDADGRTSSAVDDVFFVVRKCVRRSLSSAGVDCICAMVNNACAALDTDYFGTLREQLRAGYPTVGSLAEAYSTAAAAYSSVIQQGKIPAAGVEGAEKARQDFLLALNNVDSSAACVRTLKETLDADFDKHLPQQKTSEVDRSKLAHACGQLDDVAALFEEAAKAAMRVFVAAAVKPQLKAEVDSYAALTHAPTEAEFNEQQADDAFVNGLISAVDRFLNAFESQLTDTNQQRLVDAIGEQLAALLERAVLKATFNQLGALQLDEQLRQLTAYLTSVAGWTVRERFGRLAQMAALLNVDSAADARDCHQQALAGAAPLSAADARAVLALRVDIAADDLRQLKL